MISIPNIKSLKDNLNSWVKYQFISLGFEV